MHITPEIILMTFSVLLWRVVGTCELLKNDNYQLSFKPFLTCKYILGYFVYYID